MKKSFKIAYSVLFLLLLCLPAALTPFFKNDVVKLEKRAATKFPAYVENGHLNLEFSDQFEKWVNDSVPLRAELLTASNTLKGSLLQGQTANVVVGSDGWIYSTLETGDYLGSSALSDDRLRSMAVTLSLVQEAVEANGGHFTFLVAPNKSSVYPEYLPFSYRRAEASNLTRLQALLPEYGVTYTDLCGLLSDAKQRDLVYHKRDSHWNYRGALCGANAILDSLGRAHDDHAGASFTVRNDWRGDLDKQLLPAGAVMDEQIYYDVAHAPFQFTNPKGVSDPQQQLGIFMSDREERDMNFSTRNKALQDGSNLLMVRDSFGRALLPWMIDAYETATFRRADAADVAGLPAGTDVAFEIAERNLKRIVFNKAPFVYAPERAGITADGLPAGEPLEAVTANKGYTLLCGVLPEGIARGDGRVYLLLSQDGVTRCFEAFPVYDKETLGAAEKDGFSAYFPADFDLHGSCALTLVAGGVAYPCNSVEFP